MIITKTFSIVVTLVRFITSVYMKMHSEMTALIKSASTVLTLLTSITNVYTNMTLEITIINKSFSTVLIGKVYHQCVYEHEFGDECFD